MVSDTVFYIEFCDIYFKERKQSFDDNVAKRKLIRKGRATDVYHIFYFLVLIYRSLLFYFYLFNTISKYANKHGTDCSNSFHVVII